MKYGIKPKCPGCKLSTDVEVKKPGFMSPVFASFECESCESIISIKVALGKQKTTVNIFTLSMTPSMKLIEMLKEEEEFAKEEPV